MASAAVLKAPNAGVDEEDHAGSASQCSAASRNAMHCNATFQVRFLFMTTCAEYCALSKTSAAPKGQQKGDEKRWRCVAADEALLAAQETGDPSFCLGAKKELMTGTGAELKLSISSFLANKQKDPMPFCSTRSSNPVPSTYLTARQPPTRSRARSDHSF
jgi:hypothetical protein